MPVDLQARFQELIAKREAETLSPAEYEELLRLTDDIEQSDAQCIVLLIELARLREATLADLMHQLGIRPPSKHSS